MATLQLTDQETQLHRSTSYLDNLDAGETDLVTNSTDGQYDFNALRSQIKRILDHTAGNWYDDVSTVNGKKRSLKTINTDLDDLETKKFIYPAVRGSAPNYPDISIPAAVNATGQITAVTGAELADGDYFTIPVKSNLGVVSNVVFEFDNDDSVVETDTLRQIEFVGTETLNDVRTLVMNAINAAPVMNITPAANVTDGVIDLTCDYKGSIGNVTITENVADADFVVSGMTGGAGDIVILSVAGNEAPTSVAAIGANTTVGAIVAQNTTFGTWSAVEVEGRAPIWPKNIVYIRNGATGVENGQPIEGPNGKDIMGLLQCENGVNGHTFDDDDEQVMISFVVENSAGNDLEFVDASYIGGKTINYQYHVRVELDNIPEDAYLPGYWIDMAGIGSTSRQSGYDHQGTTPVELANNATLDIGTDKYWLLRDVLNADLLKLTEGSTGGTTTLEIGAAVDVFDVNAASVDFAEGITVDSGGEDIEIGITAGQINSTSTNDLTVLGAGELLFDDGNRTASTFSTAMKFTEDSTEWDNFELEFGEVSLIAALLQGGKRTKGIAYVITADIDAGTNITGNGVGANISAQLPSWNGLDFVQDVDLCINGIHQTADLLGNLQVYPGTNPEYGDFKCTYKLKVRGGSVPPDFIIMTVYGQPTTP